MARKAKTPPAPLTREQQFEEAKKAFFDFHRADPSIITTPDRKFSVGDEVKVGSLLNCKVMEVLLDGKALLIEYNRGPDRDNPNPPTQYSVWWWFDCVWDKNDSKSSFMRKEYRGQVST